MPQKPNTTTAADPRAKALLRTAYAAAAPTPSTRPTLFAITTALEELAIRHWGPPQQGSVWPRWQQGLTRIGLGTTADVLKYCASLGLGVASPR